MPTSRSGGRRRKTTTAKTSTGWDPVFSGDDNIVAGEVLVTLSSDAADAMTESVPLHPAGPAGSRAFALGVDDLDSVLSELGAYDITRLAPSATGMADAFGIGTLGLIAAEDDNALSRSFRVRIDASHDVSAAAAQLEAVSTVAHAEPNRWREATIVPNDPQFATQWGLSTIKAPAAWDTTTGAPSVVVAVIDSGVDLDHPELAPLLLPGYDMVDLGPSPTPKPGWRFEGDFSGRDSTPEDEVGHGTHVSGTIACLTNNGSSVAGVNWQSRILPIKALTRMVRISDGRVTGVGSSADIAAAIRWAADNGAHVINMSLGSSGSTVVESSAVAYAIGKGVVVVAAMGNDGTSNPSYPAAYPGVVAVGAIDSADHRASFSQTGAHISVAAPGVDILSTYLAGGTTTMSGTSMATPHVAGVAALIKAAKPSATGVEIADILRTTARPLRDDPADAVPNDQYGAGCIDAEAAVLKAAGPQSPFKTVVTVRLRTPLVLCPPKTLLIRDCLMPVSPQVFNCGGFPRTIIQPQCIPVITPACPRTPTITPTITTTPQRGFPIPGQRGYDPYGLLGGTDGADPQEATSAGTYEDGYAAGYAAAVTELQASPVSEAEGQADFQSRPYRSVYEVCIPNTITSPQCTMAPVTIPGRGCPLPTEFPACPPYSLPVAYCPVPTPWWRTINTTTPQVNLPGRQPGAYDPYGQGQYGYDPYGQNPFEG
ncbi:MAG TPA: S8 family serine peptidase [Propionibacteriaceae bacterium]